MPGRGPPFVALRAMKGKPTNPNPYQKQIMQTELTTYMRAGYPGLAITTAEEARASAEVNAVCAATKRKLSIWSSTDGLIDIATNRSTPCPDPFEALQLLERLFASASPQHVILLRDLQLHLDQADPMLVRRMNLRSSICPTPVSAPPSGTSSLPGTDANRAT